MVKVGGEYNMSCLTSLRQPSRFPVNHGVDVDDDGPRDPETDASGDDWEVFVDHQVADLGRRLNRRLEVFSRRVDTGENRQEAGHRSQHPTTYDRQRHLRRRHSVVVQQGTVDDGVVSVDGDAAEVKDGWRTQSDVHRVVNLGKQRPMFIFETFSSVYFFFCTVGQKCTQSQNKLNNSLPQK